MIATQSASLVESAIAGQKFSDSPRTATMKWAWASQSPGRMSRLPRSWIAVARAG